MITLYTVPGTCSNSPHMLLEALQIPYQAKVLKWGGTPEIWQELEEINPTKQVPAIKTEEGYVLTEGSAILQYLSDRKGGALMPKAGESRYRALEWLNFISTDLHKGFGLLFGAARLVPESGAQAEFFKVATAKLANSMSIAERRLSASDLCVGSEITLPDYYLATVLSWSPLVKFDLTPYPRLQKQMTKIWSTPEGKKVKG